MIFWCVWVIVAEWEYGPVRGANRPGGLGTERPLLWDAAMAPVLLTVTLTLFLSPSRSCGWPLARWCHLAEAWHPAGGLGTPHFAFTQSHKLHRHCKKKDSAWKESAWEVPARLVGTTCLAVSKPLFLGTILKVSQTIWASFLHSRAECWPLENNDTWVRTQGCKLCTKRDLKAWSSTKPGPLLPWKNACWRHW